MQRKEIFICNWCNQPSNIIWVHGHGQCSDEVIVLMNAVVLNPQNVTTQTLQKKT